MSTSSSRSDVEPDKEDSITGKSIAKYETNWTDKDLSAWQLPNVAKHSIYKRNGVLNFKTLLGQITKEIDVEFQDDNTFSTNLFNKNSLKHYYKLGYNNMHIGSVQIGIKPLSKVGLNNSMLVCLRDGRITDYKESIIGLAESSLTYGPIYFQCYPNFQISLKADKHKEKCLVVDVQIHNYKFVKGSSPYKLIYRVHYRVLSSGLIPSYIPPKIPAGQTICYNASETVDLMVPIPIPWDKIKFPDTWTKERVDRPIFRPPMRDLNDCIADHEGNLRISFRPLERSLSSREPANIRNELQSARRSLSNRSKLRIAEQIPDYRPQYRPTHSESSSQSDLIHRRRRPIIPLIIETRNTPPIIPITEPPTHITGVYKTPEQVAQPIHVYDNEGPSSPTPSQVLTEIPDHEPRIRSIDVLNNPKEIDKTYLSQEYYYPENTVMREKYEKNYSSHKRKQFHSRWMRCIETLETEIPFFQWYTNRHNLEEQCLVLDQQNFKTYKSSKGDETRIHPPPRTSTIEIDNETPGNTSRTLQCVPFIIFDEELPQGVAASSHQIGVVIKQNNFSNEYLTTIGEQLDRIENNQSQTPIISTSNISPRDYKMKSKIAEYEPGTILFPDTTGIEKCFDSFTTDLELVKMLQERLDKLPKPEIRTLDGHISSAPDSYIDISDLDNMIQKLTTSRIDSHVYNKYNNDTKPYYPRPTPPDLQYE